MAPPKQDNWICRFEVSDPRKHSRGFTIYKVTSITFPKGCPEAATKVTVWKRYNDIKKLHSKLKIYHKKYKINEEIPKLCKAKYFQRFDENVLEERIECILNILNFIGRHQALFRCVPFLEFFENGYQVNEKSSEPLTEVLDNGNVEPQESDSETVQTFTLANSEGSNHILTLGGTWDSPLIADTISVNSKLSDDDDSFLASDTTESVSSVSSPLARDMSLDLAIDSVNSNTEAEDIAMSMASPMTQSVTVESSKYEVEQLMTKSMSFLPDRPSVGETVTCHSEKPIPRSEMWLSVRTEDFRGVSKHSMLTEAWLTPPGTPADIQPEDYIVQAAYHVGQAQSYEVAGDYEASFSFYKGAIASLLSGVQDDTDKNRRQAVKEKISRYVQRADKMYSLHLASVPPSITELKVFRVLRVLDRVMLVLNTLEEKCYVIKVLEKSPCPVDSRKKTIVPRNVPYMVQLVKQFENCNSVFLVLQYASGGRLWDHIENYLLSVPSTPVRSPQKTVKSEFQFSSDETPVCSVETAEGEDRSYLELIKEYTTNTALKIFGYSTDLEQESTNIPKPNQSSESHFIFDTNILSQEPSKKLDVVSTELSKAPMPDLIQTLEEVAIDRLQVTDLLENSQRLLASVTKTLRQSETVTSSVNKELEEIEHLEQLKLKSDGEKVVQAVEKVASEQKDEQTVRKKRSSSVLPRGRFERRFSDDLMDTRSRTASSSLDRCGQWSRLASMVDPPHARLSEATIRGWAAELLVALETLHRWGIVCRDLTPDNLLLGDHGHLLLTFQCQWREVDLVLNPTAISNLFAAPETTRVFPITSAADWWSYGALLYELLTGQSLVAAHPTGILGHTILNFPSSISAEATSLLTELLRYEPSERLGAGLNGSDDIKCHPFFSPVDWQSVYDNGVII